MKNYTAPELLLVGAAQHLVLAECPIDKTGYASAAQVADNAPSFSCREEPGLEEQYDDKTAF